MSLDRTLKQHGSLRGMRSVLTRAERIALMTEEDKFDPDVNSPLGLPKTRVHHSKAGSKKKKAEETVDEEAVGDESAQPADTPATE
ncbi:MAG: small basic protein [Planctomycetes bacterium]|nr:small basic protein [Planctomycetota bacterium]